jgi:hypothetical protein
MDLVIDLLPQYLGSQPIVMSQFGILGRVRYCKMMQLVHLNHAFHEYLLQQKKECIPI